MLTGNFFITKLEAIYMKQRMKQLISSVCAFILLGSLNCAFADNASDTETLLNWAENTYPQIFPSRQATQNLEPWLYRFYPETGVYAGVNKTDQGVYVMGGQWGNNPTYIDSLASMISLIQSSGGNGEIAACDTTNIPDGFSYSQSGDVVTVSTNGQCISIPTDTTNFCETPLQPSATGISVLSTSDVTSSEWSGITLSIPVDPSTFFNGSFKSCTINAPDEQTNLVVNTDICLDVTTQLEGSLSDLVSQGYATINPPITYAFKSTYTSKIVADCFATDADSVYDAFTNEVWIKQNGDFVEIPN